VVDETEKIKCHETVEDNIQLLVALVNEIKGLGKKQMYNFIVIGKTLTYLKYELNYKNEDLDKFFQEYGSQYNKPMRNFYIRLYKFWEEYNNLMHVDLSAIGGIGNLFNKWSKLKGFIIKDAIVWK
jgi:hypothetical protein